MLPILGSTKQDLTFYESHALNITDREYYIFDHIAGITMVSVSTVQPSINLVFLCTDKNLKMPLYTLLKVSESTDFQI